MFLLPGSFSIDSHILVVAQAYHISITIIEWRIVVYDVILWLTCFLTMRTYIYKYIYCGEKRVLLLSYCRPCCQLFILLVDPIYNPRYYQLKFYCQSTTVHLISYLFQIPNCILYVTMVVWEKRYSVLPPGLSYVWLFFLFFFPTGTRTVGLSREKW